MANTKQETLFWGILILVVGLLFLLKNFGLEINVWRLIGKYWPMVLIFIGIKNIYIYAKLKNEKR